MNGRQLQKLGVPELCVRAAIGAVQALSDATPAKGSARTKFIRRRIQEVVADPNSFTNDPAVADLAQALIEDAQFERPEPINYQTWGTDIDGAAHGQMKQACSVPMAVGAALMPDAHVGYGLPIGGVLAVDNAVIPYAVGVDIACRMKLSVFDLPTERLRKNTEPFERALENETYFGVGVARRKRAQHDVMDQDWSVTRITREKKDTAWNQLGTSGSGNHFVEFGLLTVTGDVPELSLPPGEYVALMSHSGSRGAGAAVCSTYSAIARAKLDARYQDLAYLAWLSLDSQEGQEYWLAMNLMGEYASANHHVIHDQVAKAIGGQVLATIENHHNFAWKEMHQGREVIVHRKGATPAGPNELGVIPGSMADPAFVVRGKGNPSSLNSASHGAGRRMSRQKAKERYTWNAVRNDLLKRGVKVISAGADEVPGAYKNIHDVMAQQQDLVETIARFDPRVVKMCGDGSRAED